MSFILDSKHNSHIAIARPIASYFNDRYNNEEHAVIVAEETKLTKRSEMREPKLLGHISRLFLFAAYPFFVLACVLFEPVIPEAFGPAGGARRYNETEWLTNESSKDNLITPVIVIPSPAPATPISVWRPCAETEGSIGEEVICKIEYAYCFYSPTISGSPTFCSDAPSPNHNFTLVVWQNDWSDLDGQFILVNGLVTLNEGQPQVIATSRSQISICAN